MCVNCKEAGLPLSFQVSIERRSKKDAFSYIGSKAAWTGVPTLPLVGPVIWDPWSSVLSSVRWEGRFLLYRIVLKDKWENI